MRVTRVHTTHWQSGNQLRLTLDEMALWKRDCCRRVCDPVFVALVVVDVVAGHQSISFMDARLLDLLFLIVV